MAKKSSKAPVPALDRTPPWDIVYYAEDDDTAPALQFLGGCPPRVEAQMVAVLNAVAAAPPPAFAGGGKWEAMHGSMGGYYEVRVTGPGREQFRLFCVLENGADQELVALGYSKPVIAVIAGMRKPNASVFSDEEYRTGVREHGSRHLSQRPRRIVT